MSSINIAAWVAAETGIEKDTKAKFRWNKNTDRPFSVYFNSYFWPPSSTSCLDFPPPCLIHPTLYTSLFRLIDQLQRFSRRHVQIYSEIQVPEPGPWRPWLWPAADAQSPVTFVLSPRSFGPVGDAGNLFVQRYYGWTCGPHAYLRSGQRQGKRCEI